VNTVTQATNANHERRQDLSSDGMKLWMWREMAVCFALLATTSLASAALQPGQARSGSTNGVFTLENDALAVSWVSTNGNLLPVAFVNRLATQSWAQAGSELFRLSYSAPSAGITSSTALAASACNLIGGPQLQPSEPNTSSTRLGDRLGGQELVASFADPSSGILIEWRAVLRDGANYVRQFLSIHGTNSSIQIGSVELPDYATAVAPVPVGTVVGSPVIAGQAFFGGESPFASSILTTNRVRFSIPAALPLGAGGTYEFSSVAGVFRPGQLRRDFMYYLERERAAPYRQLLHFNSWFDAVQNVSEAEMLAAVGACELELHQRRGVPLNSYVMDDGWDNPNLGFWAIDPNKFPHQFDLLQSNVTSVGSHLGLWISPLGGYSSSQSRLQAAINEGIVTNQLDLSIPTYYSWWTNQCAAFVLSNAMNYFKWDNAGNGVSPHFMALLRSADFLHGVSTNLFLNITVGTWPSPFWLSSADSIWRGGTDLGSAGVGDAREQWITYRDSQVWRNIVDPAPLYPVTSLMLGGIVQAKNGGSLSQAGADLRHDVRSFFGSGLTLQELFLTPSMLTSDNWNQIAEAAAWARSNADILVDSHWVGGNPVYLQPYGWAAWSPSNSVLVLRNPSSFTNAMWIDIGKAFELPDDAPTAYTLSPAYTDQRSVISRWQAGQPLFLTLLPFEVLVFKAAPAPDTPQPPTVTVPGPPPTRYTGSTVKLQAAAQGSLPLNFQWRFNGVPMAFATNSDLVLSNLSLAAAGNYSVTVSNVVGTATSEPIPLAVRPASAFAQLIVTNSPVAWWRMDETNGPIIADSWGDHSGVAFGNLSFGVPGPSITDSNSAIHFGGAGNGKVDVAYSPALNPSNFSFSCWVRVTGGDGTYRSALTSRTDTPVSGYLCYASGNNRWEFWTGNGNSWDILAGPPVVAGAWTHIVGTFDGTNKAFYVNGQQFGSTQSAFVPNASRSLRMGAGATESDGNYFFPGDIDEVAIFNRALSSNEVVGIYFAGLPPQIQSAKPLTSGGPVYQGITASPSIVAIGQLPLSYRWTFNGMNLTDNGHLTGSQSNSLSVAGVLPSDAGTYQVTVSNSLGTATTNFILAVVSSGSLPVPSGVVAWWPAEGSAQEIVGGNDGTWGGAETYATGMVGAAFRLDSSDQFVTIPYSPLADWGSMPNSTVEAWINPSSLGNQSHPTILSKGQRNISFGLSRLGGRLESWINSSNQLISTFGVPSGQWSHVAMVYEGTNRTFYINGQFAGSGSAPAISNQTSNSAIGNVVPPDPATAFAGAVDEVTLYNRALTPAEIQSIYLAGADGKSEPPVMLLRPRIQTVVRGTSLTVSPTVAGTGLMTFQWLFNGTALSGATNATLVLTDFQPSDAGNYQLVATSPYGCTTSSVAPLTAVSLPSSNDGIPNYWRAGYFGGDGSTTNRLSCLSCDASGTGQDNLFKYVAGLDPTNPVSVLSVTIASVSNQPSQKKLVMEPIAPGRDYAVEFTTNLATGTWQPLDGYAGPTTNGGRQLVFVDTNAALRAEFYRIRVSYAQPNADSVGDGIPDWWRQQYFGGDGTITNSQSCATCDPSGAGQNNLFKYMAGLSPLDPNARFALDLAGVSNAPGRFRITFSPLAPGRSYLPQFTTNLTSRIWLPLTSYTTPVIQNTAVTITDTNAVQPQKFYRLILSLP
jgi:hypothetical protein